jgi:hypothetical protein
MELKHTTRFILIIIIFLAGFKSHAQAKENIEISELNLRLNDNKLLINWSTGNSEETNYFEIERSYDGKTYKTIAYVLGPDPTQSGNHFGYYDKKSDLRGTTFYRVKHVDSMGNKQYSDVKRARL